MIASHGEKARNVPDISAPHLSTNTEDNMGWLHGFPGVFKRSE